MLPLVNHITMVPMLISKKSWSKWTMCVLRGLKTNMLDLQLEKLGKVISVWGVTKISENIHSGITKDLGLLEADK